MCLRANDETAAHIPEHARGCWALDRGQGALPAIRSTQSPQPLNPFIPSYQPAQQTPSFPAPCQTRRHCGRRDGQWITAGSCQMPGQACGHPAHRIRRNRHHGCGRGHHPPLMFLHDVLEIEEPEFVRATQATFKLGISFENWRNVNEHYFHSFGKTGKSHWSAGFQHFWLEGKQRGSERLRRLLPRTAAAPDNRLPPPRARRLQLRLPLRRHALRPLPAQILRGPRRPAHRRQDRQSRPHRSAPTASSPAPPWRKAR